MAGVQTCALPILGPNLLMNIRNVGTAAAPHKHMYVDIYIYIYIYICTNTQTSTRLIAVWN